MPFDETLGLAQVLLGLLLFTVGIPALIIEIRVDESLRRLLHKRMHPVPLLVLGGITLSIVLALFLVTGQAVSLSTERLLRMLSASVIVLFAAVWYYIYRNLRISAVVREVVEHMKARLGRDGTISSPDLSDLLTAGENLEGYEKTEILVAVGELIQIVQRRHEYGGTRLEALIRGLPRIVERNGSVEHHNAAMRVVTQSWTELVTQKLENEKDADFILNAASALSLAAVERRLESVALRWVSAFSLDVDAVLVIDVPYRIGAAAIEQRQYRIAIAALNRLALIASRRERLPKELVALFARFDADGRSARQIARRFIEKLGYSSQDFQKAAASAVIEFENMGDCSSADAIQHLLESSFDA